VRWPRAGCWLAGRKSPASAGSLVTGRISAEADVQGVVERDPYTQAGVARYDVVGFNAAVRARVFNLPVTLESGLFGTRLRWHARDATSRSDSVTLAKPLS